MPRSPRKPCGHPGCGRLTEKGNRCDQHRAEYEAKRLEYQKRHNARRAESDKFYSTTRWRKLAAVFKRQHPLCQECERRGYVTQAQIVDHIVPRKRDPARELDWTNLRSLCRTCHNHIGQRVERGRGEGEVKSSQV
jgi:5-methylcytosine-specific restriction protein A